MVVGKEQYVYRAVTSKCSCGTKDFTQYLDVRKDHGIIFNDFEHPLMNANDYIYEENIHTFGRCRSVFNPNGHRGVKTILGPVGMLFGWAAAITVGCPCKPLTPCPWVEVDDDYFIEGAPALTSKSILHCAYGGEITITYEVVKKTDETQEEQVEEETDKIELLPSEVQEKIDSFTDDAPSNPQKTGTEEMIRGEHELMSAEMFQELLEGPHMVERYNLSEEEIKDIQINENYTE